MYKTKEVFKQETLTLILTTNGLLIFLPSALIQTQTRLFKIFIVKICVELESNNCIFESFCFSLLCYQLGKSILTQFMSLLKLCSNIDFSEILFFKFFILCKFKNFVQDVLFTFFYEELF